MEIFIRSKFVLIHLTFLMSNLNVGRVTFRRRTWSRWLNKGPDIKRRHKSVSLDHISRQCALCQEAVRK